MRHPQAVLERDGGRDGGEGGVVALAQRFELARPVRPRRDVAAPARGYDARPDIRHPVGADVEQADLLRAEEPLVRAPGVGVASEVPQVHVERAPALRAVDVNVNAAAVGHLAQLAHRQPHAGDVRDMRQRQHPGARRQSALEGRDKLIDARRGRRRRHSRHRQPVTRRPYVPGDVVGRMVLIPHHDLVARPERQPRVDDVVGLARVAHEGDLVGGDPQPDRHRLARRLEQRPELLAVRKRAVDVDVAGQLADPLGHRPRRGAEVRRVHRHPFLAERELAPDLLPERLGRVGLRRRGTAGQHRLDHAADGQGVQESAP